MTQVETLYCYIHPNRPTTLRCNRCNRPICTECAIRTPTGYRCPECVREQQKKFDTAEWYDYISAFVVAAVLSAFASGLIYLVSGFFFGILVLFIAPAAGVFTGNMVLRAIHRHRSRALFATAAVGMIVGALPALLMFSVGPILGVLFGGHPFTGALLPAIWMVVYLFLAVPAAYTQISGLRIGG
ncbi:MAG TPA: B-box zinc finger protein [Anaerolineales bacterium]|nr:B-box zinc finger protein [Anaerolineales bacterium]